MYCNFYSSLLIIIIIIVMNFDIYFLFTEDSADVDSSGSLVISEVNQNDAHSSQSQSSPQDISTDNYKDMEVVQGIQ